MENLSVDHLLGIKYLKLSDINFNEDLELLKRLIDS